MWSVVSRPYVSFGQPKASSCVRGIGSIQIMCKPGGLDMNCLSVCSTSTTGRKIHSSVVPENGVSYMLQLRTPTSFLLQYTYCCSTSLCCIMPHIRMYVRRWGFVHITQCWGLVTNTDRLQSAQSRLDC